MFLWPARALATFGLALFLSTPAMAHCDGLDGPVVAAARKALDTGDPNPVLIWVQPSDEAEIRTSFAEVAAVRRLGPQARELADRHFFETLVRLHRAGEGAPYTGLKPAGRDLGPAIPLADKAVESGSNGELVDFMSREVQDGVRKMFVELQEKRNFRPGDLAAGRDYVAGYVAFVHYIEQLHEAATARPPGHYPEDRPAAVEHHEVGLLSAGTQTLISPE